MNKQVYNPQQNLLEGLRASTRLQLFPWDHYFPQMTEADFLLGRSENEAVKSFFVRTPPFGNAYIVAAGITAMLRTIADLDMSDPAFQEGILDMGFSAPYAEYLKDKKHLRLQVWAPYEGDIFFPNEPVISVRGPIVDVSMAEGIITEACNFPMLSATKWHRLKRAAGDSKALDFSRRRAQNAFLASLYATLAGCEYTSNDDLRQFFAVVLIGTMGHEWIMRFGDVFEAFMAWLSVKPDKPIGLVDTLQCMEHDFPLWLKAVELNKELIVKAGSPIWGWRNDSGDLAELTIEQYKMFLNHPLSKHGWFWERMRIVLTNDLDEHSVEDIRGQILKNANDAGLDAADILRRIIWAAGTKPGTCQSADPDYPGGAIGGVMKIMESETYECVKLARDSNGQPGIKTSIPGFNLSAKIYNKDGKLVRALIYPYGSMDVKPFFAGNGRFFTEEAGWVGSLKVCLPNPPRTEEVYEEYVAQQTQYLLYDSYKGDCFTDLWDNPTIQSVSQRLKDAVAKVHWTSRRLNKPETIKTCVTPELYELREEMIAQGVLRSDKLK